MDCPKLHREIRQGLAVNIQRVRGGIVGRIQIFGIK